MADEISNISGIINQLPQKLQLRFASLGTYVQDLIEDLKIELKIDRNFSREEIYFMQYAAFIYSFHEFLSKGSSAARIASTTFESLGVSGFIIGTSEFTKDNSNTERGAKLAQQLQSSISNTKIGPYIAQAASIKNLVTTLMREIENNG